MVPPAPATTDASDAPSLLGDISHKRINAFGKRLSVIRLDGEEFLIGVQIASLLKRETFNMYRSMKIKNITIQRANPEQVDFLCKCNAVRTGTHSVTLIPYEAGLYFIADAVARQKKTENLPFSTTTSMEKSKTQQKSFIVHQPKLHRRKAHPWDVHRSIKKEELILSGKNSPYADIDTPITDIKAKQLAITKLTEIHGSAAEKAIKRAPQKGKPFYDPFTSLLFAAGSLEDLEMETSSPSSSPSSSLNPSPSSSLNSSPVSSPTYSPYSSPQSSPPHSPSQEQTIFTILPHFNLGIFTNSSPVSTF